VRSWYILSAIGHDRPGIVADLAQLIFDCDANLDDSRMTILGNEFAAILLCSGDSSDLESRLAEGTRRLESEHRLSVFLRPLEGEPRPPVPAPGTHLVRIETEGTDRAGIVACICRTLADHRINIADLRSDSVASMSGSAIYLMTIVAEVPNSLGTPELHKALDEAGGPIGVEVRLEPV